jgi:hypothetical protein
MRLAAAIRKRLAPFLIVSAALHLVISLFLLLVPRHVQTRVVEQPAMKIYPAALLFAGGTKAEWTPAPPGRKKHFAETKQTASDLTVNAQLAPAKGAPVSAPESTAAGNGADQSNADPAFPVFSPRPPVADRSLLPDSNREVVVDVKVSAAGDVLEATLVKGPRQQSRPDRAGHSEDMALSSRDGQWQRCSDRSGADLPVQSQLSDVAVVATRKLRP